MAPPAAAIQCNFFLSFLLAVLSPVLGKVLELNGGTFRNILLTHKRPLFVEFYSPDCYFCQQLEHELDLLSENLKGRVTVAKLDARGGYDYEDIHVKATPTLMLFKNGKPVEPASIELNGFRTANYLQTFLEMHLGPDVAPLTTVARLEAAVQERGMAVVGLFENHNSPGAEELEKVAKGLRSHIRFFSANSSGSATPYASKYQAHKLPSIFILKKHGHTVFYHGSLSNEMALRRFVDSNAYPLVGNFSMLTYYRYTENVAAPLVCLFYDNEEGEGLERAVVALEETAMVMEDRVKFVTVERHASEEDGRMILRKMGLSFFKSPALAIRSADRKQAFAYNQMWEITAPRVAEFVEKFLQTPAAVENRCWTTRANSSRSEYTDSEIENYADFAADEKSRLGLADDDKVRDVDNEALQRLQKSSRKDILIIFTARWCAFSLQLEDMVGALLKSGALEEIQDEITVVRYDVVANKGENARSVHSVPSLKYVSARYKTIPHWYTGSLQESEDVAQFIHAYYSLRHVEIPGEGPSPFKKKKEQDRVDKVLKFISQEMI